MGYFLHKVENPDNISRQWNQLAADYFQTTDFLVHCQQYNYCFQRYYELYSGTHLLAGACVYSLRLDLGTYAGIKSPVKMNIVGIPASVASMGLVGNPKMARKLLNQVIKLEKGFVLALNLDWKPQNPKFITGFTLPNLVVSKKFKDFNAYKNSLRSNYRRRLQQLQSSFGGIRRKESSCKVFGSEHYNQYLQVYNRSDAKLEQLSLQFFSNLGASFRLVSFYQEEQLLGWHIYLAWQDELNFFLGGLDYQFNHKYNTYFNLINDLLQVHAGLSTSRLILGQTAEEPKLRAGSQIIPKYMTLYHRSKLIRFVAGKLAPYLEYNFDFKEHHVFNAKGR
ncbi:MAG: hypothetical protein PF689_01745 [Deltaproteobacteria bacterium]|jgi:hypothetical protein|nr:hypothetical protein [Deltaproteobacteria bacterium]